MIKKAFVMIVTVALVGGLASATIGGSTARYKSFVSGQAAGKVAEFDVVVSEGAETLELDCFDASKLVADYVFDVTSNSEVPVTYDVIITFPEVLPEWLSLKLDGGVCNDISEDGKIYVFEEKGSFGLNDQDNTNKHTLSFAAESGLHAGVTADLSLEGICISVVAKQSE